MNTACQNYALFVAYLIAIRNIIDLQFTTRLLTWPREVQVASIIESSTALSLEFAVPLLFLIVQNGAIWMNIINNNNNNLMNIIAIDLISN